MIKTIKEVPGLLLYWDLNLNILDLEITNIHSRHYANWICPNCSYQWEAKINEIYRASLKNPNFCPCCNLGKILVSEINSIKAMFPDFENYINYHREDRETISHLLQNQKFNSRHIFQLKCPTCHSSWRDAAINLRLFQSEEKEIFHIGCNELSYQNYYTEVYPNLGQIYNDELNDVHFNELKLNTNVTKPMHWKCDKCLCNFTMPIDSLFARIRRNGSYCTECNASFNTLLQNPSTNAPLDFLTPEYIDEWSEENIISPNQVDALSNIPVIWSCSKCKGSYSCKVYERTNHSCPYCSDKLMLRGFNTLDKTHPYLKQFLHSNNLERLTDYWHQSTEEITWKCPCCDISFECSPKEMIARTDSKNAFVQSCPNFCEWTTSVFKNNSLYNEPILIKEWSEKNKIPMFLALINVETKKYWWNCSDCKNDYLCSIPIRREIQSCCPYCNNELPLKGVNTLFDIYPELKTIWDTENNITTESVILDYKSNRNYSWRCNKCQLSYRESINVVLKRYLGDATSIDNICPSCNKLDVPYVENNISETHPHLLKEWDYRNNMLLGNPENHTENSKQQVWWICNNNSEHRYKSSVKNRIITEKRNQEPCSICKGFRRKRAHFVQFKK
ncbi:TPA: zinc-ribbon domain-containing protein [Streptococcus suis]